MSNKVTIYHNPRCTKSRQTLQLLRDRGVEPEVIDYLKAPPSRKTIGDLIRMLGCAPREVLRKKEKEYRAAGLSASSSEQEAVEAIAEHPVLLERPIVVCGKRAAIGRPPEQVLEIL